MKPIESGDVYRDSCQIVFMRLSGEGSKINGSFILNHLYMYIHRDFDTKKIIVSAVESKGFDRECVANDILDSLVESITWETPIMCGDLHGTTRGTFLERIKNNIITTG